MAALDIAGLSAVLKTQYTQKRVNVLTYPKNPMFAMVPKRTDFVGVNKVVAFQNAFGAGRSNVFSTALANITGTVYNKVTVTRVHDYALAEITGEAIDAAGTDGGSLLNALKKEIDNAIKSCTRSLAIQLYRNSGGARGQLKAGISVTTPTITLRNINDITNFEQGMVLTTSAADGTSGAIRAGSVTIAGVDRDLGTITVTGNWDAGIAAVTANDYIFQQGDFVATAKQMVSGLAAWLPLVAPVAGDNFFGLDRSVDTGRLAGIRYSAGSGGPIEESLISGATQITTNGGTPDHAFMNPVDYANLIKALGSKVEYDMAIKSSNDASIAFKGVNLHGPAGEIKVVSDLNCPQGYCYMLQMDTWNFETLKAAPRILEQDGMQIRANASADSYILRAGWYGQLTCDAPGWNGVITL